MPSAQPIPTLADLRQAFADGVVGQRERRADTHDGSSYDLLGGMSAILFSRQAQRDRDLFRANYFESAEGDDLTTRGQRIYGVTRNLDAYGVGTATIVRPNASAGQGTVPAGTRFTVYSGAGTSDPRICTVTSDVQVGATALIATLPIRATTTGTGTAVSAIGLLVQISDSLWDTSWTVQALQTADGTVFEKAEDYRARIRNQQYASRQGYELAITAACVAVGAVNVKLYPGNWTGDGTDLGFNLCYVGDAGYNTSTALLNACSLALESVRVLGGDIQVLPMTSQSLSVNLTVSLYDDPGSFNTSDLTAAIQAAVASYFDGRRNAYSYQLDAIAGAVRAASTSVQGVVVNSPASSVNVTTSLGGIISVTGPNGSTVTITGIPNFPAVLTRYVVVAPNVSVSFVGPQ